MVDEQEGVEEEKDTLEESPTSLETDSDNGEGNSEEKPNVASELLEVQKSLEGLRNEKAKLEKEVGELRLERRVYRTEKKPTESSQTTGDSKGNEQKPEPQEGAKNDLERFKVAQKAKARKAFIKQHPEYGELEADAMFSKLESTYERVRANTDMDSDEILEDMETAWAVVHRDDILKKGQALKRRQVEDEMSVADLAATSESSSSRGNSVKATPSDYRSAKIAGMPIDKYLKLKGEYEKSSFSF